jgi:hypothetical protein
MPLPRTKVHEETQASAPQAHECLLPDNTPREFRVLLSACCVFLGTEKPAKLQELLRRGWSEINCSLSPTGMG